MRTAVIVVFAGAALVAACGREPPSRESGDGTAIGMTAEEHARMLAGTQGGSDTSGAARRDPVRLSAAQAQAIGVTFVTVERGTVTQSVRTVGQVVPAEPRLAAVTAKVDGFVEQLFVDATGVTVRRGEPLLALYSPMLVAAQEELLTALRLAATVDATNAEARQQAADLVAATRRRLAYWDITAEQIARLERTGEVTKTLTLVAPFDGAVLEKMVVAGQAVMPGMTLYRLADLATVWIEGEVFERDMALVRVGTPVMAEVTAFPGRTFRGRVSFVWPVVDAAARTGRVRVSLPNGDGALKPGMYATLAVAGSSGGDALLVPAEAVVMTGERNLVFVVRADGALVPRAVTLGVRAGDRYQVLTGVSEGERIVASANFLVDAESRLTTGTATTGMPGMPDMPGMGAETKERRP